MPEAGAARRAGARDDALIPASQHPNQRPRATLPVEFHRAPVPAAARAWIERATGQPVTATRRLPGASSSAIHAVTLADGTVLVLRRYVWPRFLVEEPDAPAREADALRYASSHGLPVPDVVAHDPTGAEIGDGIPATLMTRVAGRAVARPDVGALADVAARIHALDGCDLGHDYFRWYDTATWAPPGASSRPALWERALVVWRDAMPTYEPALVHRDFHPGNVLWSRGRLGGVVDWANACRGPRGCDLAHCCWNLVELGDGDTTAADTLLAAYRASTGEGLHPYWVVASLMDEL